MEKQDKPYITMTIKFFIVFLKKEYALEKFLTNFAKDNGFNTVNMVRTLKMFMENVEDLHPNNYINYAFLWRDTDEGRDFWVNLSHKWIDFIQNNF